MGIHYISFRDASVSYTLAEHRFEFRRAGHGVFLRGGHLSAVRVDGRPLRLEDCPVVHASAEGYPDGAQLIVTCGDRQSQAELVRLVF